MANRKTLRLWGLVVAVLCLASAVGAHFNLNQNVRVLHVVHTHTGINVYARMPMAYLVADKLGPEGPDGIPAPAPYTLNRIERGSLMHLVDFGALSAEPLGLARIAAGDLLIRADDKALAAEPVAVRVHAIGREPGFATLGEAKAAMAANGASSGVVQETYVGDAVVDLHLRYSGGYSGTPDAYDIAFLSDPGLPGQNETANLLIDHRDGASRTYRATGLMTEPLTVTGMAGAAAATFVTEGIRHITGGLDHVLFVICLVIGASSLGALTARVTGFTLGHSVTLIAGFFGFVPTAAWFIPAVETAIALSILYAAADAVFRRKDQKHRERTTFAITAGIGLLHGFGFSFLLREILQVNAANVWQSLLAFNIGVEIGQLAIVLVAWPAVLLLRNLSAGVWLGARGAIAAVVSCVAIVWTVERMAGFLA